MSLLRRLTLALALIAGVAGPAAAERVEFTQARFDAAATAGKPVLVEVWASWCPVCQRQDPLINSMLQKPAFKDVVVLSVDFDKAKDVLRQFNVTRQSTLIAFKGGKEVDRSIGDTSAAGIEGLTAKAK